MRRNAPPWWTWINYYSVKIVKARIGKIPSTGCQERQIYFHFCLVLNLWWLDGNRVRNFCGEIRGVVNKIASSAWRSHIILHFIYVILTWMWNLLNLESLLSPVKIRLMSTLAMITLVIRNWMSSSNWRKRSYREKKVSWLLKHFRATTCICPLRTRPRP